VLVSEKQDIGPISSHEGDEARDFARKIGARLVFTGSAAHFMRNKFTREQKN
jgi:hypothetical protein